MDVLIKEPDLLSRLAVLFELPLSVLRKSNAHIKDNLVAPNDVITIPGYWTRYEDIHEVNLDSSLQQERICFVNHQSIEHLTESETIRLPVKIQQSIMNVTTPYTSEKLSYDIELLQTIFPFIHKSSIGQSTLGKEIWELRIGCGPKKIHINASMHANEWITSLVLMKWVNDYLLALSNGKKIGHCQAMELFMETELSIIPMVNPDGVDLVLNGPPPSLYEELVSINHQSDDFTSWKANIRGVDLNDQFPANWELEKQRSSQKKPASRDYPGPHPLSEAEAIHLVRLVERECFLRVIALHTQGHEFYWGYEGCEPDTSSILAREFTNKTNYRAVRYVNSHAGFKDWFIQTYKKEGVTIELGKGINPLPLSQFPQIYQETVHLLNAAVYL